MGKSVLFVCLGNICRSPLAEAVFASEVKRRGLEGEFDRIDSCGTGDYHIGEEPDERTVAVCKRHGIQVDHLARQICEEDFTNFDWILASDEKNLEHLKGMQARLGGRTRAKVGLFGDWTDGDRVIRDPYYMPAKENGFERVYHQCQKFAGDFLEKEAGSGPGKGVKGGRM